METQHFHQQLQVGIPAINSHLQKVAESFELKFQAQDYHYFPVTAHQKVLLDYLGGCPGLPHSNWGQDDAVRRQNVGAFLKSDDFIDYSDKHKSGGSVLGSIVAQYLSECCHNDDLPEWVSELSETVNQHAVLRHEFFVVLTLQEPSDVVLQRLHSLLAHEWSHLLYFSNGIKFQTTAPDHPDCWLYDEGLATWSEYAYKAGQWDCQPLLENVLTFLQDRGDPRSVTGYFEKGLWYNAHFRNLPMAAWPGELKTLNTRLPA